MENQNVKQICLLVGSTRISYQISQPRTNSIWHHHSVTSLQELEEILEIVQTWSYKDAAGRPVLTCGWVLFQTTEFCLCKVSFFLIPHFKSRRFHIKVEISYKSPDFKLWWESQRLGNTSVNFHRAPIVQGREGTVSLYGHVLSV